MKRFASFLVLISFAFAGGCKSKNETAVYEESPVKESRSYKFEGCITPDTFIKLVEKVGPAVVNINTTTTVKVKDLAPFNLFDEWGNFFSDNSKKDRTMRQTNLGSGFIINKEGYIITNNHVVEKADEINVTLSDDTSYLKVKVIGKDPKTDVALIKIEPKKELFPVVLGDSDSLKVGEVVVAIGNPFGLSHTVTQGIVSAKERTIGLGNYESFIQTDASINPGNSGGPLLNIDGEVVGINTAIVASAQGIGFSIPINLAKNVITQLKETGKVKRAWIGVYVQKLTDELARSLKLESKEGALVSSVTKGGPAEKAGIKGGDVIVSFDGKKVKDFNELPILVTSRPVGAKCEVVVIRDGKKMNFDLILEELQEKVAEEIPAVEKGKNNLGLTVEELTDQKARELGLEDGAKGVILTDIAEDSPASDKGLQSGDVIVEMNKKKVKSINDFNKITSKLKKGDDVLLFIRRGAEITLFIAFTL